MHTLSRYALDGPAVLALLHRTATAYVAGRDATGLLGDLDDVDDVPDRVGFLAEELAFAEQEGWTTDVKGSVEAVGALLGALYDSGLLTGPSVPVVVAHLDGFFHAFACVELADGGRVYPATVPDEWSHTSRPGPDGVEHVGLAAMLASAQAVLEDLNTSLNEWERYAVVGAAPAQP